MKTPVGKPFHSDSTNTCLLFIYPHRGPFPPPHMRSSVGVLLTGYRKLLTVLLVPANSDLLQEPVLFDSSTALWVCLKITMDLRVIEPTTVFSPWFCFKFACLDGNTDVPLSHFYQKKSIAYKISDLNLNLEL